MHRRSMVERVAATESDVLAAELNDQIGHELQPPGLEPIRARIRRRIRTRARERLFRVPTTQKSQRDAS